MEKEKFQYKICLLQPFAQVFLAIPSSQMVKNPLAMRVTWVQSLGWEDPLKAGMANHSSILVWRIHGQRNLAGYSPWGHKESDVMSD